MGAIEILPPSPAARPARNAVPGGCSYAKSIAFALGEAGESEIMRYRSVWTAPQGATGIGRVLIGGGLVTWTVTLPYSSEANYRCCGRSFSSSSGSDMTSFPGVTGSDTVRRMQDLVSEVWL